MHSFSLMKPWPRLLTCCLLLVSQLIWCDETFVSIHNLTPYIFSVQTSDFDGASSDDVWDFPSSIRSGSAEEAHLDYSFSITGENAGLSASATYSVDSEDGTTHIGTFDIYLDLTDVLQPSLWAQIHGFGASGRASGWTFELGYETGGGQRTPFILAGGFDGTDFTATYPSDSWMQDNLGALGCRQLREICMPGSHDAAMSEFHNTSNELLVYDFDVLTQTLDINAQLKAGARYFDIRPVINGGHYTTGHFSGNLGADGQSMQDIVWNINNFTEKNAEVIILAFSSSVNRDDGFRTFDQDDWNGLMGWTNELNHRWVAPCTGNCDLTQLTLKDLISDGTAAIIMINYDGAYDIGDANGWYNPSNFPMTGSYANTISRDDMREDQYTKLAQNRKSSTSTLFQLFWTLTSGLNPNGIVNWADGIYTDFFDASGSSQEVVVVPQTGLLRMTSPSQYPNIVTIDNIKDANTRLLTSLTIGLSRLYATCPQVL